MVDYKRQVNIRLTEDEWRRIKSAVALRGKTLQDVGRGLMLGWAGNVERVEQMTHDERQKGEGDGT